MLDLLITRATLPDGRTNMSVAIQDGRIVDVAEGLNVPAFETVDAAGQLLSPPFCDPHFHMDACLSYGLPRVNQSGTLLEGIALWGELKPLLTAEALIERALDLLRLGRGARACSRSAAMSTSAMRACWPSTRCIEVKKRSRALSRPAARRFPAGRRVPQSTARWDNLMAERSRLRRGRRRRHSAFRAHDERGRALSVQRCCASSPPIWASCVDMHCDETDDPMSRHVETLAFETHAPRACRAASTARISPRCIAWTTTTSPSSSR
jgi:cytosine deaminase